MSSTRKCTRRKTTRCPFNTNVWPLTSKPARPTSTRGYPITLQIMLPCEARSIRPSPLHTLSSTQMLPNLLITTRPCTLHHFHRHSQPPTRRNSKHYNPLCSPHTTPQPGLLPTERSTTSVLRPFPILRTYLATHRQFPIQVLSNEQTIAISGGCPYPPSRCLPKLRPNLCNHRTAAKTQRRRRILPTKMLSPPGRCNHRHNQQYKLCRISSDGRMPIWAVTPIIALLPPHHFRQKRKWWSVLATVLTQMIPWQQCSWLEAKVFRSLFITPTRFNFTRFVTLIRLMTPWAPPCPQAPWTCRLMTRPSRQHQYHSPTTWMSLTNFQKNSPLHEATARMVAAPGLHLSQTRTGIISSTKIHGLKTEPNPRLLGHVSSFAVLVRLSLWSLSSTYIASKRWHLAFCLAFG